MAFELRPGDDLFDGATFKMLLERFGNHPRCCNNYDLSHFLLKQLDCLGFICIHRQRISPLQVEDAELRPKGCKRAHGAYQPWPNRAGRFRSLDDGQIDFRAIFSKTAKHNYSSWVVLEWECCLKHPEQGAAEGPKFIADHIIQVTESAFDDFAGEAADPKQLKRMLGMSVASKMTQPKPALILLGMVDGGEGAFISAVHRMAARDDGLEVVAIVTPRHLHTSVLTAFSNAGIYVICDKPLANSVADAKRLQKLAAIRARWCSNGSWATSAGCKLSTRKTGSAGRWKSAAKGKPTGAPTSRAQAQAAALVTSAAMLISWPNSSLDWK